MYYKTTFICNTWIFYLMNAGANMEGHHKSILKYKFRAVGKSPNCNFGKALIYTVLFLMTFE